MKKIIFGIFAHPDDEAFGPAGTLLLETRGGTDLHLITLTHGDAGMNPDNYEDLGKLRLEEWQAAGKLLGAKSMRSFDYKDGELNNKNMIEICQRIIEHVDTTLISTSPDVIVEFITLDINGMTGHIDHIVTARAVCLAFYRLKTKDERFYRIRFNCLPDTILPTYNIDWIYAEPGRTSQEVNEIVDARSTYQDILTIMRTHHSQRSDGELQIKSRGESLGLNYFTIKN